MLNIEQGNIGEKTLPFHKLPSITIRAFVQNSLNLKQHEINNGAIYQDATKLRNFLEHICMIFGMPVCSLVEFQLFLSCARIYRNILIEKVVLLLRISSTTTQIGLLSLV